MNGHGTAIGWGTPSLINAGLAQTKGRSGVTWFLLSLLLGPLATLAIVMMSHCHQPEHRSRRGARESRSVRAGGCQVDAAAL